MRSSTLTTLVLSLMLLVAGFVPAHRPDARMDPFEASGTASPDGRATAGELSLARPDAF
ncbi:MAG TPA: hypothetical protein VIL09_15665 [Microvirga sp.]|jgi:hypothetical protein